MQRTEVESSMMASVGYDMLTRTLEIEFVSGRVYQYFDVPRRVHRDLIKASSLGSFFNDQIRDVYPYAPLNRHRRRGWA